MLGKAVIVGIGNPMRGDDGFGPALIERLRGDINAVCIDAGNAPENHAGRIVRERPDTILLVDVAHLDLAPGQFRILQPAEILHCGFSTHTLSCRLLIEFLNSQTKADIFMLAVQPASLALGDTLSKPLNEALDQIACLLRGGVVHEIQLLAPIVQGIASHARREGAGQVLTVRLRVGELTAAQRARLNKTFEILARDTLLEQAGLELNVFPGSGVEVMSFDIDL